jgi:hypothetical protein
MLISPILNYSRFLWQNLPYKTHYKKGAQYCISHIYLACAPPEVTFFGIEHDKIFFSRIWEIYRGVLNRSLDYSLPLIRYMKPFLHSDMDYFWTRVDTRK